MDGLDNMESKQPLHVLVVGAGLAGIAIAHGLRKHNISYLLVDRETTPRDRNWGITLSWALPLLEGLLPADLVARLQDCQPDTALSVAAAGEQGVLIRDGLTGAIKIRVLYPDGVRRMQIQKTKRVLSAGLHLGYGKRLVSLSYGDSPSAPVTASFSDGTTESATVVVGADGGSSQVRRCLLGDAAAAQEVLPYAFMNFPFRLPADRARWLDAEMNPSVDVAPHPKSMYLGLFLLDKPDLDRPETWVFYLLVTWPIAGPEDEENTPNRLERLRAHMDGWADPYKSVVEWLADDTPIGADQLRIWHPKPWDNKGGRVTLAGDAAHSMTFHRGQGGNLAIKDADEFVRRMVDVQEGRLSLQDAMDQYDKGVVARGEEVEISRLQAAAFHDYENFDSSPVMRMGIKPSG